MPTYRQGRDISGGHKCPGKKTNERGGTRASSCATRTFTSRNESGLAAFTASDHGRFGNLRHGKASDGFLRICRQPDGADAFDQIDQRLKSERFDEIGIRPGRIGVLDILLKFRTGQDNDRQALEHGMLANKAQNIEAGSPRHLEIQQNQSGPNRRLADFFEISERLLAVGDIEQFETHVRFATGRLQERRIVRIIVDVQDSDLFIRQRSLRTIFGRNLFVSSIIHSRTEQLRVDNHSGVMETLTPTA